MGERHTKYIECSTLGEDNDIIYNCVTLNINSC